MKTKNESISISIASRIMILCSAILVLFSAAYSATLYVGAGQSYTTIQDAVNAASAGDVIIVKDGTYTENVNVNKQLTIQSENGYNTTIVVAVSPSDHVFEVTADYVTIEGFTTYGATNSGKAGIYLGSFIDHCTISNNRCGYDYYHRNHYGIYLYRSSNNTISWNTCNENYAGIRFYYQSQDNTILGNTFESNSYGINLYYQCDNNTFFFNNFIDNNTNVYSFSSSNTWSCDSKLQYEYSGTEYENYLGNYYSDFNGQDDGSGGRTAGDGIGDSDIPHGTDSDGDNYPLIAVSDNYILHTIYVGSGGMYTTIQRAVDASPDDCTIIVRDGTYTENVDVNKQLTIQSENGYNSTTVEAASSSDHVFEITADYVTIQGFTIYGSTENGKAGIFLDSGSDHCTICDNRCGYDASHINYYSIYLRSISTSHNTISDNVCSFNSWYGINIGGTNNNAAANICNSNYMGINISAYHNTVAENECGSNDHTGIYVSGGMNKISDNTCTDNEYYGIWLSSSKTNTLSGNECISNKSGIYLGSSTNNTISGNTCNSNNSYGGIDLYGNSNDNIISDNICNSNKYGIRVRFSSNDNSIYLNSFSSNTTANVYSDGSTTNAWHSSTTLYYSYASMYGNSMGNYYSDHTLTDSNGDGITDSNYNLPGSEPNDEYPLANTSEHYSLEVWWLASNDTMYSDDMTTAPGNVGISGESSHIWIAEEAEQTTKYFSGSDPWTGQVVFTLAPTNGHTFSIEIGYSNDGSDFTAGNPYAILTGNGSTKVFTFSTDVATLNVPEGKYLALRITNNNSGSYYYVTAWGGWSYVSALPITAFMETNAASIGSIIYFNESGDGHGIDMSFTSLTGSGNVTVQQTNASPSNSPCTNACSCRWDISKGDGITAFSADITFHYIDADVTGYTESHAYLGISKFNSSTNTWQWLGGTVNAANNTVTVSGVSSFSTFALFRRIFGDITGDGYVDAADLQRLGDVWHQTNSGEFTGGSDARFFNYNKNTSGDNQIIDAADLQVFGDCWHNGVAP